MSETINSVIYEQDVIPDRRDSNGYSCGFYHAYHVNGDNIFPLMFSGQEVEHARIRAIENPEDVLPLTYKEPPMSNWMAFCIGILVCGITILIF